MKRPSLGSAVYVIPNLLTTGNLFFGYFSIIKCLQGDFKWAASAVLLAAIFDVLDGRVARLTGGTSEFGVQYDSLCDLVSFGLAPAFLMYKFALNEIGRPGWLICFLFLACGALRLARFNVQSSIGKSSGDFTGLPIPMAAAVVCTFVATSVEVTAYDSDRNPLLVFLVELFRQPNFNLIFLSAAGAFLAFAMVSNFAYRSHKVVRISAVKPFRLLVLFVVVLAVGAYEPELFGLTLSALYAISGPLEWLVGWKKPIDEDDIFSPIEDGDTELDRR
jgi:CDP-diacylglycerol--serine O-phosphatidyltransferase